MIRAAAHLLEAAVEDIEAADGRVFVAGTDRSLSFREIAKAVYSEMGRLPREAREEMEVTKLYDPYFGTRPRRPTSSRWRSTRGPARSKSTATSSPRIAVGSSTR